jgi:phosphatidylinositol alpha-1,6-mannosyltransferase
VTRTLVVTNDFPPRQGGIQTFVAALLARRPPDSVVVLASDSAGSAAHDAALPYPVVRRPTSVLLPTPGVARATAALAREHGCDSAFFGAAAPLGLLAPSLRAAGVRHLVGATHGHETGWVALPGARQLMRRIAGGLDVVTYISEYTRSRLEPVLGGRARLAQLSPGVDVDRFTPDADGAAVRRRYGLGEAPVVVCVSRLVARKGQDVLVAGWPRVLARHPAARLLLVGGGPAEASLRRAIGRRGLAGSVVLTGPVPPADLPAHYAAGDAAHELPRAGQRHPAGLVAVRGADQPSHAGRAQGRRQQPQRRRRAEEGGVAAVLAGQRHGVAGGGPGGQQHRRRPADHRVRQRGVVGLPARRPRRQDHQRPGRTSFEQGGDEGLDAALPRREVVGDHEGLHRPSSRTQSPAMATRSAVVG